MTRNSRDFDELAKALQKKRRVACPDIVGRGRSKESDVLLESTVEEMRQRGRRVEVVEIPGVGHAPTLTAPEHIRIVRDWLLD